MLELLDDRYIRPARVGVTKTWHKQIAKAKFSKPKSNPASCNYAKTYYTKFFMPTCCAHGKPRYASLFHAKSFVPKCHPIRLHPSREGSSELNVICY